MKGAGSILMNCNCVHAKLVTKINHFYTLTHGLENEICIAQSVVPEVTAAHTSLVHLLCKCPSL